MSDEPQHDGEPRHPESTDRFEGIVRMLAPGLGSAWARIDANVRRLAAGPATGDKVNVAEIRREGIGVTPPEHGVRFHPPEEVQVLTGDENIVNFKVIVQYRVKDPADFLLRVDCRGTGG